MKYSAKALENDSDYLLLWHDPRKITLSNSAMVGTGDRETPVRCTSCNLQGTLTLNGSTSHMGAAWLRITFPELVVSYSAQFPACPFLWRGDNSYWIIFTYHTTLPFKTMTFSIFSNLLKHHRHHIAIVLKRNLIPFDIHLPFLNNSPKPLQSQIYFLPCSFA